VDLQLIFPIFIGSILELARWLHWIYENILYPLIVEQNAIENEFLKF
jgi:hypothetical protein